MVCSGCWKYNSTFKILELVIKTMENIEGIIDFKWEWNEEEEEEKTTFNSHEGCSTWKFNNMQNDFLSYIRIFFSGRRFRYVFNYHFRLLLYFFFPNLRSNIFRIGVGMLNLSKSTNCLNYSTSFRLRRQCSFYGLNFFFPFAKSTTLICTPRLLLSYALLSVGCIKELMHDI